MSDHHERLRNDQKFLQPMLLILLFANLVSAAPNNSKRASGGTDGQDSSSLPPTIWIPILVLAVLVCGVTIMIWAKKSFSRAFSAIGSGASAMAGVAPQDGTRELTADQLAGSISRNTPNPATTTTARRTRRPRRTPSQISTVSLPLYNKEPGEHELVIFGPRDMEDAGAEMPSVDEEHSLHSRNNSETPQYSDMPTSPSDMPLMNNDDESADFSSHLQPPGEGMPLRSTSTQAESTTSLPLADPRGDAPAYFEVVDLSQDLPDRAESAPPQPEQVNANRRSFLGLFTTRNTRNTTVQPSSHSRGESIASLASTVARPLSPHRASQSVSGSIFSGLRRKKSTATLSSVNLTSPSTLSVHSISHPLTHTLTRTEFTYPKSGPTPEQLKLISSRESFVRFGRPYGADAIAYAASTSRQELPPDFDFDEAANSAGTTSSSLQSPGSASSTDDHVSDEIPATEGAATMTNAVVNDEARREASDSSAATATLPPLQIQIGGMASRATRLSTIVSAVSPTSTTTKAPPTSFKPQGLQGDSASPPRSESRASSFMSVASFATAAESMNETETGSVYHTDGESEPTTPTRA